MSEIRVNKFKNRAGLGTVSVSDDGLVVSGIVTSQTLEVTGNAIITGNANIAGVLTYEDVTNVDSVGLVTARQGVRLGTDASGVTVTGNNTGIGIGNASPTTSIDISTQTGAVALPQGTTAQRPAGNNPYIRFNTTNSALEFYNGTNWVEIITDYFPTGSTTLG